MRWVSSNFKEILPDCISYLTSSLIEDDFAQSVRKHYRNCGYQVPTRFGKIVSVINGKPYFNCDLLLYMGMECWGRSQREIIHILGVQVDSSEENRFSHVTPKKCMWLRQLRAVWIGWRSAQRIKFPLAPPCERNLVEVSAQVAWDQALENYRYGLLQHLQINLAAAGVCRAADLMRERLAPGVSLVSKLLSGDVGGTISSEQQRAFRKIFVAIKHVPTDLSLNQVEEYFHWFGHRCRYELEISIPRPIEDKDRFLTELKKVELPTDSDSPVDPVISPSSWSWRQVVKQTGWASAMALNIAYRWRRWWLRRREASKFRLAACAYQLRKCALFAGSTLQSRGLICKDDVFYLTKDELMEALADPTWKVDQDLIDQRRRCNISRVNHPELLDTTKSLPKQSKFALHPKDEIKGDKSSNLYGVAVSPGIVTGTVCIVSKESDSLRIKKGDVVVMPSLDNGAGVVFMGAGGIITEVGGTLSHAAIIARELGIPAVFNVPDAQKLLADGMIVTVDGNCGLISIVEP